MLTDAVNLAALHRVLVVKLRHHGDVLLTSPVFTVLKNRAPHLEIDALVYRGTEDMLTGHPAIRQVYTIDRGWKKQGPVTHLREEIRLLRELRTRHYDLLIHLTESSRGAWLAHLLGPEFSVVRDYAPRRGKTWHAAFSHRYRVPAKPRHTVEIHLDALRRLGLQPRTGRAPAGAVRRQRGGEFRARTAAYAQPHAGRLHSFSPDLALAVQVLGRGQMRRVHQSAARRGPARGVDRRPGRDRTPVHRPHPAEAAPARRWTSRAGFRSSSSPRSRRRPNVSSVWIRCRCTSPRPCRRRWWRCSARAATSNGAVDGEVARAHVESFLPSLRPGRLWQRQGERVPDHHSGG